MGVEVHEQLGREEGREGGVHLHRGMLEIMMMMMMMMITKLATTKITIALQELK